MIFEVKMSTDNTDQSKQQVLQNKKKKRVQITPEQLHLGKYIRQLQNDMHLSKGAVSILDTMTSNFLKNIINSAESFRRRIDKDTLNEREIRSAVILLFPRELTEGSQGMISFANHAVEMFNQKKKTEKKEGEKKGKMTTSVLAGLIFPVSRIKKVSKRLNCSNRIGKTSAVFLTAAIQFIISTIIEISASKAEMMRRKTINLKAINTAISDTLPLTQVFSKTMIFGLVSVGINVDKKTKKAIKMKRDAPKKRAVSQPKPPKTAPTKKAPTATKKAPTATKKAPTATKKAPTVTKKAPTTETKKATKRPTKAKN